MFVEIYVVGPVWLFFGQFALYVVSHFPDSHGSVVVGVFGVRGFRPAPGGYLTRSLTSSVWLCGGWSDMPVTTPVMLGVVSSVSGLPERW